MGNVLSKNTAANSRYTQFENNQVLTADQLNDLFRYLDIQSRLTRTRGIGVGIICGLEIGQTEEKNIIVSKGTAITTDGDLVAFTTDMVFDQYVVFEDANAKYEYFRLDNGNQIKLYELLNSKTSRTQGKSIAQFDQDTSLALKDFVGIAYQEDYENDTDLCTGVDCDNKGIECVREIKILLAHKDDLGELLKSIPKMNREYFSLGDIDIPRVMIKNSISKFEELRGAFTTALTVKENIKSVLQKAYEVCKPVVEDEFGTNEPVKEWNDLLDQHFKLQSGIYAQYVYDFARDLSYGYNEMRETLFNGSFICCPPVELFPKHILLGLVKTAVVKKPVFTAVGTAIPRIREFTLSANIKFDIGALIRRFHPVHIDMEYRHQFYESPVLNNKEENAERTKFCFKRLDAMIRNFKVPTAEELQTTENIKITPCVFENRFLGDRSIPFYYKYNQTLPINAYWSFEKNVRRKENSIYYYFSKEYSPSLTPKDPLKFNLLPYSFFRIEGHIGYKHQEVERMLNKIINENNLPINIMTVQVERELRTIPDKGWWFPQVHIYENLLRNNFLDQLNQAELVHRDLKVRTEDDADKVKIDLAITNFSRAREKVMIQKSITDKEFKVDDFSKDVSSAIDSATEVKVQTQKFTFSNTASPHDFLINTDILHKTDLLKDMLDKLIIKKKEDLFLGNFMKSNPGLEHAGGVLRGGTFVLVYTANDDKVVADFMLPYASIDKDVVPEPPVIKPLPFPGKPKLELPKIFEKIPPYKKMFDDKVLIVDDKIKFLDDRMKDVNIKLGQKVSDLEDTRKILNEKAEGLDKRISEKFKQFDETKNIFDTKVVEIDKLYTRKLTEFEGKLDYQGKIFNNIANVIPTKAVAGTGGKTTTGVLVGGRNFTEDIEIAKRLSKELDQPTLSAREKVIKEAELETITKGMVEAFNQPNIVIEKTDEHTLRGILLEVGEIAEKITTPATKAAVAANLKTANTRVIKLIR